MVCDEEEATGAVSEQTKEVATDADSDKAMPDKQLDANAAAHVQPSTVRVPADSETAKKPADQPQKETSDAAMVKPFRQLTELLNMFQWLEI